MKGKTFSILPEFQEQLDKIDVDRHQRKLELIKALLPKLEAKIATAKSTKERAMVGGFIDKLTNTLVASLQT